METDASKAEETIKHFAQTRKIVDILSLLICHAHLSEEQGKSFISSVCREADASSIACAGGRDETATPRDRVHLYLKFRHMAATNMMKTKHFSACTT